MFPAGVSAQVAHAWHPDMEFIKKSDPRLTGYNAAGLYALPIPGVSTVGLSFNKSDGGFVNYYQSDDSHKWMLDTESFFRASPKVAMYGRVEYSNFKGQNMGGSAFIDPYYNPFDITEWNSSTAGEKQLERYHLIGAIGAEVARNFRIGGKIDYLAANYTKFKDLRHKNKLMDMSVSAGVNYRLSRLLEIGGNYLYRRSTEGVEFGIYGNTDQQYYSLINYGAFFGRREYAGDTGYTEVNNDKPMFNEFHGGSLQLIFHFSPAVEWFNELTYQSRDGYYGIKSPGTIIFTGHSSEIFEYRGCFTLSGNDIRHRIALNAATEELINNENVYNKIREEEGGSWDIIYYDATEMLSRTTLDAKLEYEANTGIVNYNPTWTFGASAAYSSREQTVSVYPYYRKQTVHSIHAGLSAARNIFTARHTYGLSFSLLYGSGGGTDKDDRLYTQPTESQKEPLTLDQSLYREYEYLTAQRLGATLGFRFSTPVAANIIGYASLEGSLTKGFDLQYIPKSTFTSVSIKIGCSF